MRWRGPVLVLLVLTAAAGVVVGLTAGGDDSSSRPSSRGAPERGTTVVAGARETSTSTTTTAPATTTAPSTSTAPTTSTNRTTLPRRVGTIVAHPERAPFGHRLVVGTVDDALKQSDPALAAALAKVLRDAGFDAVLISSMWTRGRTAPSPDEHTALANAVAAATKLRMRVFVSVWHGLSGGTPRTPGQRQQFARYTAAVARQFPAIDTIIVGNEPNLNTFWLPQFGRGGTDVAATGYFDLLARTYDALKAVSPKIRVIGGALAPRGSDRAELKRHTHSPTQFIKDLGTAYRASGRAKPVMDAFAIHPYMRTSALSPTGTHASSKTITIGDYPKLAALLAEAFRGTAQRGRGLPVYYTEFGVQTTVPDQHRRAYTELASPARFDAVAPATQAKYYRQALLMAACQPTVRGLFVFHTFDERDLRGWQSGLYYADQQPKPSLGSFRTAAALARTSRLTRCAGGTFVRKLVRKG